MAENKTMRRVVSVAFLLVPWLCAGADPSSHEVLQRIRANVLQQLTRVANYTCVESVDRSYFYDAYAPAGCGSRKPPKQLYMHDRLRLDVAVSEGQEIFSWHGGKIFSSKGVDDVVQSGPISSGSFVGYLRNIFFNPGVMIRLAEHTSSASGDSYLFNYVVPRLSSRYHVGASGKRWIVPFHGKFTGDGRTYQLTSLQLVADDVPPESEICNAGSEIEYQLVAISGKASLIPKSYVLDISNSNHVYTVSRSDYTQCREFRGESTLNFNIDDHAATQEKPIVRDEWLPAGTTLHVRLRTPMDDRTSFTGDPVEGSLADPVKVKGSGIVIPKDAALSGVITKLEFHAEPFKHYLVSIRFQRLTFGPNSFLLDAVPKPSSSDKMQLGITYGGRIPKNIAEELETGLFVWGAGHFHKDQHFVADWRTKAPVANQPE